MKLFEDQESGRDIVQALQAAPEGCGAGLAVAFAAEEASKLSGQPRDLTHTGWSGGQRLIGSFEGKQCLPLVLLKSNGARRLWRLARKLFDVLDSPRHHQVNGEVKLTLTLPCVRRRLY